jgi:hypothetical protein
VGYAEVLDHVTYQVPAEVLHTAELTLFMEMLMFEEVEPDEVVADNWDVRWWISTEAIDQRGQTRLGYHLKPEVHLMSADTEPHPLGYSHFCVTGVGEERMDECRRSKWLEHEREGSGRLWLAGPGGIRVEVRP